jgi:hypothetical protein
MSAVKDTGILQDQVNGDFLIIPPGGEIRQEQFIR